MPSHVIHFKYAYNFLKNHGVIPDVDKIRFIDLLIDDPRNHAPRIQELVETNDDIRLCVYSELSGELILLQVLPQLGHDLLTQRYSPRKTSWSRSMIQFLRRLIKCIYGEEYELLVDLHVFLDMTEKWCCDDELLQDWASEVGIDPRILDYYIKHRTAIDLDLKCIMRLRQGKCEKRNVARMLSSEQFQEFLA